MRKNIDLSPVPMLLTTMQSSFGVCLEVFWKWPPTKQVGSLRKLARQEVHCSFGSSQSGNVAEIGVLYSSADIPPHPNIQPLEANTTWHSSTLATFEYQYTLMCSMEHGRPDRANFRRLLWKCVSRFSELAESRSRILVPLIFRFIQLVCVPLRCHSNLSNLLHS